MEEQKMFTGGLLWNTDRDLAIRINRVESFFIEANDSIAKLGVEFITAQGQCGRMYTMQLPRGQEQELDQFIKEYQELFLKSAGELMTIQMNEEVTLRGGNATGLTSLFRNIGG
jgi:hypothetical protein